MPKMLPLDLALTPRRQKEFCFVFAHTLFFFFTFHCENEEQRRIQIFTLENSIGPCEKHKFGN